MADKVNQYNSDTNSSSHIPEIERFDLSLGPTPNIGGIGRKDGNGVQSRVPSFLFFYIVNNYHSISIFFCTPLTIGYDLVF